MLGTISNFDSYNNNPFGTATLDAWKEGNPYKCELCGSLLKEHIGFSPCLPIPINMYICLLRHNANELSKLGTAIRICPKCRDSLVSTGECKVYK